VYACRLDKNNTNVIKGGIVCIPKLSLWSIKKDMQRKQINPKSSYAKPINA